MPRQTAMITGASSGIGEAFCDVFASEGFDLVITARREDRLRAVAGRLEERYGVRVHVLVDDLEDATAPARLCAEIAARGLTIDALVNNAGYGVSGSYLKSSWSRHAQFLQIMVVTVADLTYRLLPGMIERGSGRIVNVASLAGLVPASAGHTMYAAAKTFLIRFSEALAQEVEPFGVRVTVLCPGFTRSEFHDVTGTRATVSKLPRFMWLDASVVARKGFDAVAGRDPVVVVGRVNQTIALLARLLPRGLVVGGIRRISGLYRRQ